MVVLLNPAFEASFYKAFESLVRPTGSEGNWGKIARERFDLNQVPLMITLSSTTPDLATRVAFPIGQVIAFNWNGIRRTTLGNYSAALTHALKNNLLSVRRRLHGPKFCMRNFCYRTTCLKRKMSIEETGDPFIVAQAPPDIIKGHSGIWGDQLQEFLTAFISEAISRQETADSNEALEQLSHGAQ